MVRHKPERHPKYGETTCERTGGGSHSRSAPEAEVDQVEGHVGGLRKEPLLERVEGGEVDADVGCNALCIWNPRDIETALNLKLLRFFAKK